MPQLWNVQYWPKGGTRVQATLLWPEGRSYAEARKAAKACRYIPAFFGCLLEPVRCYTKA
jgi:hypothetical protein